MDVHGYVSGICFKTGPPGRVGIELEWIVVDPAEPERPIPLALLRERCLAAGRPPRESRLTFEPGGQVELSSLPAADVSTAIRHMREDVAHLTAALAGAGLVLVPRASDPWCLRPRQLDLPRYSAMERYFDSLGHARGRQMMRATASIQVNLDAGADAEDVERRWRLLHLVGPTLVAAFANSPTLAGEWTGYASTRQAIWRALDPPRTHPPHHRRPTGDVDAPPRPVDYGDYALDAPLMFAGPDCTPMPSVTLRDWLTGGIPGAAAPTEADIQAHLTTLFPPVRARGFYEVRYLDMQSPTWWPVPALVLDAVLEDPAAGESAARHCSGVAELWDVAARDALSDGRLAVAARGLFTDVIAGLPARVEADLVDLVQAYARTYVFRGRTPADDPDPLSDPPRQESR